jgi:hypothetical protein
LQSSIANIIPQNEVKYLTAGGEKQSDKEQKVLTQESFPGKLDILNDSYNGLPK